MHQKLKSLPRNAQVQVFPEETSWGCHIYLAESLQIKPLDPIDFWE